MRNWAPEGKILFSRSFPGNPGDVMVMDADGSNQTDLTISTRQEVNAAVSPDGKTILFQSNRKPAPISPDHQEDGHQEGQAEGRGRLRWERSAQELKEEDDGPLLLELSYLNRSRRRNACATLRGLRPCWTTAAFILRIAGVVSRRLTALIVAVSRPPRARSARRLMTGATCWEANRPRESLSST